MSETISSNTTTTYITLSAGATLSVEPGVTLTGTGYGIERNRCRGKGS